jgi:hypothetical protein
VRGLDELDLDARNDVRPSAAPTARAGAEEVVPKEGREEIREVAEVDMPGLEAAAPPAFESTS